jgi:hypothetical protein
MDDKRLEEDQQQYCTRLSELYPTSVYNHAQGGPNMQAAQTEVTEGSYQYQILSMILFLMELRQGRDPPLQQVDRVEEITGDSGGDITYHHPIYSRMKVFPKQKSFLN